MDGFNLIKQENVLMKLLSTMRFISTAILLLASSLVLAANIQHKPYVGFGMGYANSDTNGRLSVSGTSLGTGVSGTQTLPSINSFTGNVYVGDEVDINRFSLALEALLAGQTGESNASLGYPTGNSGSANYYQPVNFGISILPGFYITPRNHVYGRVGYVGAYYHEGMHVSTPGVTGIATRHLTDDGYLSGLQLGLGYEYGITQHLFLRAEYDYQHYGHADSLSTTQRSAIATTNSILTWGDGQQNIVTVGLNYKF